MWPLKKKLGLALTFLRKSEIVKLQVVNAEQKVIINEQSLIEMFTFFSPFQKS